MLIGWTITTAAPHICYGGRVIKQWTCRVGTIAASWRRLKERGVFGPRRCAARRPKGFLLTPRIYGRQVSVYTYSQREHYHFFRRILRNYLIWYPRQRCPTQDYYACRMVWGTSLANCSKKTHPREPVWAIVSSTNFVRRRGPIGSTNSDTNSSEASAR